MINKQYSTRELTNYWLQEIVIGLNLCPFARIPYQDGLIRIVENESILETDQLSFFLDELEVLQKNPSSEMSTTIISYIKDRSDFADFNDFVGLCEDLLIDSGLEEHFQLVIFHPLFVFENKDHDHPANLVGRSPFPTIHILRNAEIEIANASYTDMVGISARNEEKLMKMSTEELNRIFFYL